MRTPSLRRSVALLLSLTLTWVAFGAEEDPHEHLRLLRERFAEGIKAGRDARFMFRVLGAVQQVRAIGRHDRGPTLEIMGNKLDVAWGMLEDHEQLDMLRGFVAPADAEGLFSVIALARSQGLFEIGEKYEVMLLEADRSWKDRLRGLHAQYPLPPPAQAMADAAPPPKPGRNGKTKIETPPPQSRPGTKTASASTEHAVKPGPRGEPGAPPGAKVLSELRINSSGVYENLIVDGKFGDRDLVRITADNVTLRRCTIRNSTKDAIEVYGKNVVIEHCKIHHLLAGSFKDQYDAHGITGRPEKLIVRDCEIAYVSGDAIQFDPSRQPWNDVVVEHCSMWTGPLPEAAGRFKKGEVPGENAIDTKNLARNARARLTLRNCVAFGWKDGPIDNMAAFNIKENVEALIEGCVLYDNEIGLRLRGPGRNEGAHVTARRCAFFDSETAIRLEDKIEQCRLENLAYGQGLKKKIAHVGGNPGKGFHEGGASAAPTLAQALALWGVTTTGQP